MFSAVKDASLRDEDNCSSREKPDDVFIAGCISLCAGMDGDDGAPYASLGDNDDDDDAGGWGIPDGLVTDESLSRNECSVSVSFASCARRGVFSSDGFTAGVCVCRCPGFMGTFCLCRTPVYLEMMYRRPYRSGVRLMS